jgi:hypothetical protein
MKSEQHRMSVSVVMAFTSAMKDRYAAVVGGAVGTLVAMATGA